MNVRLTDATGNNLHEFGMCGYKNPKHPGYSKKIEWVKKRFEERMKYKVLHNEEDGVIGSIEYIPGAFAWRPVLAADYMFIHCMFILKNKYKAQGYGKMMLDACWQDAMNSGLKGVAVVTRKGSWMTGKELFIKNGFEITDQVKPDFELLVKKNDQTAADPKFVGGWEQKLEAYKDGLYLIVSDQCPYLRKLLDDIGDLAEKEYHIDMKIIELKSSEEAREVPAAFGTFAMIYNGKVVADNPISKTRFVNILNKVTA